MSTPQTMAALSRHVDALETLADAEVASIAASSPLALSNLLARLARLQHTIATAAQ